MGQNIRERCGVASEDNKQRTPIRSEEGEEESGEFDSSVILRGVEERSSIVPRWAAQQGFSK